MALSYLELDIKALSVEEVLINGGMLSKGKKPPHPEFSKKRFAHWITQGKFVLFTNSKPKDA